MAINRIYVDIDSLMDANFALCRRFDREAAAEWLRTTYRNRRSNEFWLRTDRVDEATFRDAWANRKVSLLRDSLHTNMTQLLGFVVASIDWGPHTGDTDNYVELSVNVAPYELSGAEMQMLQKVCEVGFPYVGEVRVINEPMWALSPRTLGETYDLIVLYNFVELFRSHLDRIDHFDFCNKPVFAPRLFHHTPEKDTDDWKELEKQDIFTFLPARLFGRCQLLFQDPHYFSIVGSEKTA